MFGIAGLLGLLMVGASVDITQRVAPEPDEDDIPITGSEDNDTLLGDDADNSIEAYMGDDIAHGAQGDDTIDGGAGDDLLNGGADNDLLIGGDGDDTLIGEIGDDIIHGGQGQDDLRGYDGADSLFGDAGNDLLIGGSGDDILEGGADNDALMGGFGEDIVDGGDGSDVLMGNDGDDTLFGVNRDAETHQIEDDQMRDYLNGGKDDDRIIIGANDIATGGEGQDDFILGDWIAEDGEGTIQDYDPLEDALVVVFDDTGLDAPEVSVQHEDEDPSIATISLNGTQLVKVSNAADLTEEQVSLISSRALEDSFSAIDIAQGLA